MAKLEVAHHLWHDYLWAEGEDVRYQAFEDIVHHYQYLVEAIARKLQHRLPSFLEDSELISSGQLGLLRAIKRYDPEAGPFSRYASTVIYGAIIDGLRSEDFAPSSLRRQQRDMEAAIKSLRDTGVVDPTPEEIASVLDIDPEEVRTIQYKVLKAEVVPSDPTLMPARSESALVADMGEREMCREFVKWLKRFDMDTQRIVVLKYWKSVPLKDVAVILNLPLPTVRAKHAAVLDELHPFMVNLASDWY